MDFVFDLEEDDVLDSLEDLFDDLDIEGPTEDQLYTMYGVFLTDIVRNPIIINGEELKYNSNRSNHPLCRGKMEAFEHIITRESKISKKRNFDRERSNKIHWIRPIIENVDDSRIKYFERVNHDDENQMFYWYEDKMYIVIVRQLTPGMILITAFSVDEYEEPKYKRYYNEYRNDK